MAGASSPLRPLSLRVENFRGLLGEHTLDLRGDLTLLIGKNGAGKSSLLIGLEWCLFGAETTKKTGSGIAERTDWLLAAEGARGDVRVTLEMLVDGGSALLTRSRGVDAKVRDEDVVELELPGNEVFRGEEVAQWMAWNRMPDWSTWKRSFCQHQEQSRARVTDAADRATAIAAMLGLDEYRELNDDLRRPKAGGLRKKAKEELERLEQRQKERAQERPLLLARLEERLAECGAEQVNAEELKRRRGELLDEARGAAPALGIDPATLPEASTPASDLLEWGPAWKAEVTRALDRLGRERRELSGKVQALEAAVASLAPARAAAEAAKGERDRVAAELGSIEAAREERERLASERAGLEEQRKRLDAAGQLLRDAAQVLAAARSGDVCPVCDQERAGLAKWVERKLGEHGPQEAGLDFEQLSTRDRKLEERIERLTGLEKVSDAAERQVVALEENVRAQLPADTGAAPDELLTTWRDQERAAEEATEAAEAYLERHGRTLEVLDLLVQVRDLRSGPSTTGGDVMRAPGYVELRRAIDAAHAFADDLEALGSMARTLEDEQSEQQLAAVNTSIDTYLTTITADADSASRGGRVRVKSKKTATKITYLLVDAGGRVITGKLNQAAFNALSLATLFASAESRARAGRPQFLVLDDPGQSLDDDHLAGLARALARCARFAPVIVGTFPGTLAQGIAEGAPTIYHVTRSAPGAVAMVRQGLTVTPEPHADPAEKLF